MTKATEYLVRKGSVLLSLTHAVKVGKPKGGVGKSFGQAAWKLLLLQQAQRLIGLFGGRGYHVT